MDRHSILAEMETWTPDEQIQFAQDVWDRAAATKTAPPLSAEVRDELDKRLNALNADPNDVVDWQSIVDHVRRKR